MRSFITKLAVAFALVTPTVACDMGSETSETKTDIDAATLTNTMDVETQMACNESYRAASSRIEEERVEGAFCKVDSDCTVTVVETGCTGEMAIAIGAEAEASFMAYVDRLDASMCNNVPTACTGIADEDPAAVGVACVQNRCTTTD